MEGRPALPLEEDALIHFERLVCQYFDLLLLHEYADDVQRPRSEPEKRVPGHAGDCRERLQDFTTVLDLFERSKVGGVVHLEAAEKNDDGEVISAMQLIGFQEVEDEAKGNNRSFRFCHSEQLFRFEKVKNGARRKYHRLQGQRQRQHFMNLLQRIFVSPSADDDRKEKEELPFCIVTAARSLRSFLAAYKSEIGSGPFIKGLQAVLRAQKGREEVICWHVWASLFTQSCGASFAKDALLLLSDLCFVLHETPNLMHAKQEEQAKEETETERDGFAKERHDEDTAEEREEDGEMEVMWVVCDVMEDKHILSLLKLFPSSKKSFGSATGQIRPHPQLLRRRQPKQANDNSEEKNKKQKKPFQQVLNNFWKKK
ncbi:hypothetical protein QOT17_025210 [Balamuthia mandrillaris]